MYLAPEQGEIDARVPSVTIPQNLSAIGSQAGVQIDAWTPSTGIECHLTRSLAVGFATSYLISHQRYTGGLGSLHGSVDAYSEAGGGAAALRYGQQSYESLVSRVG